MKLKFIPLLNGLHISAVVVLLNATVTVAYAANNEQYPAVPPYPMTQPQTVQQPATQPQFSPQAQVVPQQIAQPQMTQPSQQQAPIPSSTPSNNGYQEALPPPTTTTAAATATVTSSKASTKATSPNTVSATVTTQPVFAPTSTAQTQVPSSNWVSAPTTPNSTLAAPQNPAFAPVVEPTSATMPADAAIPAATAPVANPDANALGVPSPMPAAPGSNMQNIELQAFNTALSQQAAQLQQTERDQAFRGVMQQAMPLTPEQILQLKYLYSQTQRASQAPPGIPPVPTSTTEVVNLAPGAVPPVVRLSQGFITSLVFVDATGSPWPIAAYDLGNPTAFNIQWDKRNNILMIQSKDAYTYGNMAVKLQDLPTPVMVTLIPGQQVVDYRVDMRIQQMGPQAKVMPSGSGLPGQADPVLLGILDGVPPAGSKVLQVDGGQAQAWAFGNKLLLRTRMTVISPGWIATMSSADGTNAYLLQNTPTILVSDNGALEQLRIEGLEIDGANQ